MDFVTYVELATNKFLNTVDKNIRKKIGQFFTPVNVANLMANMSNLNKADIKILDAGAGSGVLTASLLNHIIRKDNVKSIIVDLYENNSDIIPLLTKNMIYIAEYLKKTNIDMEFRIIDKNFITDNHLKWTGLEESEKYDIVISNPPYKKIGKNDTESRVMFEIVYGQPNLYFLFMAMGSKLLKNKGELIYIVPRSFTSGLYFTKFRKWFLNEMRIERLHLFVSRKSIFKKDSILQETVIIKAIKQNDYTEKIIVTESYGTENILDCVKFSVPYETCVSSKEKAFIYLPTNEKDILVLSLMYNWKSTLISNGYRMKTGLVVDFRNREWLRDEENDDTIPLLWAYNFGCTKVKIPITENDKPQYIINSEQTKSLIMKNENYLLLKRFTSKEENKRLQCVMFNKNDYSCYKSISTENHINFITNTTNTLTEAELYGLYVLFNSTVLDRFYRLLNGSTQVNANEVNSMPFPKKEEIIKIGKLAMKVDNLETEYCDDILSTFFNQPQIKEIAI